VRRGAAGDARRAGAGEGRPNSLLMSNPPEGIALERDRDRAGQGSGPWVRRALLTCIAALPLLALLGVFGQHPSTSTAASPQANLTVTAPTRLRSGLIFQVRVEVLARREIKQLQLDFAEGWWESMSVNSIVPEPSSETSHDGQVMLSYGDLPAGKALVCWIYFQANPTNVGKRREDVALLDGAQQLARVHRSLTIFP
jgi:hypothetical protein